MTITATWKRQFKTNLCISIFVVRRPDVSRHLRRSVFSLQIVCFVIEHAARAQYFARSRVLFHWVQDECRGTKSRFHVKEKKIWISMFRWKTQGSRINTRPWWCFIKLLYRGQGSCIKFWRGIVRFTFNYMKLEGRCQMVAGARPSPSC